MQEISASGTLIEIKTFFSKRGEPRPQDGVFLLSTAVIIFHDHRPDPAPTAGTEGTLQRCVSCTWVTNKGRSRYQE